jgi:hypothetical protein
MVSEFELILHHTYSSWGGLPVDRSDYNSHGSATGVVFEPDGVAPGSGVLSFIDRNSQLSVPFTPAQRSLTAVKVEVTARCPHELLNFEETLVAGHNSFSFGVQDPGLVASFISKSTSSMDNIEELSTENDGVVFPPWTMPQDKWVKLVFVHDGLNAMRFYADGQLIAQRTNLLASVPPVGPLGLSIGNKVETPAKATLSFFGIDIDEVKVWRLDPNFIDRNFLARPMNNDIAACWTSFFASLRKALRQDSVCTGHLNAALIATVDELRRVILTLGPESRDRYIKTCIRYQELWKAGQIDGPEMAQLVTEWNASLRLAGFSFHEVGDLAPFFRGHCFTDILALCAPLECDPHFLGLMAIISKIAQFKIAQESGSTEQGGSHGGRY